LQTTFCPNCAYEASSIKEPGHLSMSRFRKRVKVIPPRHFDEGTIEKRMSFCSELELEYPSVTLCMHPIKPVTLSLQRVKGWEKSQRGEMQRVKRGERYAESKGTEGGGVGAAAECYLGLENIVFLSDGWLNRFGSVQSVSNFRNRTGNVL